MPLTRKQFVEWGRIGGRIRAARLSKAKRKHKHKPAEPARGPGRPPGSSKVDVDGAVALYKAGKTLAEIGAHYGVSRERARQILKKSGYSRMDGGITIRTFLNTPSRQAKEKEAAERREKRTRQRWGISVDEYRVLRAKYGPSSSNASPIYKFVQQRRNACARGIDWQLTFKEWWGIWQASGKWKSRGRGKGYGMARFGDSGPYVVGNVEIITGVQNSRDSFLVKPGKDRAEKCAATKKQNGTTPKETARSKQYSERLKTAISLRSAGLTMDAIGKKIGMSRQWVQKALKGAKK